MFSDKKSKSPAVVGNQQNRITEGTTITGDIVSNSGMRIDGNIQGNVKTPSKVVLGENGIIKGTLECENADLEGSFSGNMTITGTLTLRASARVDGDVVVGKLAIEPGASFNATCVMKGSVKQMAQKESKPDEALKSQNHLFEKQERNQKAKAEQNV